MKLVRSGTRKVVSADELKGITDLDELNKLYALKIKEELLEIQTADHKDINEFADLLQVVCDFALTNGIAVEDLFMASERKLKAKGAFSNLVLTNLNPNNPSNKIYFESCRDTQ